MRYYENERASNTGRGPTLAEDYGIAVYWLPWAWLSGLGAGIAYMLDWYR